MCGENGIAIWRMILNISQPNELAKSDESNTSKWLDWYDGTNWFVSQLGWFNLDCGLYNENCASKWILQPSMSCDVVASLN